MINSILAYFKHDYRYDASVKFNDSRTTWIEKRTQQLINDQDQDLSELISDYCDKSYVCPMSHLELSHWTQYNRLLREAMEQLPELKELVTKAAETQAIKDFKSELRKK